MNDSPASPADATERAADVIEAARLQVLDRNWDSGEHHLDLVASPGSDILAAVEVKTVTPGTPPGACLTTVTETRFLQAAAAARAWIAERGGGFYTDLWVIVVTLDPASGLQVVTGNAAEVA